MSNFKAGIYAVMLVMLTACSKQNATPISESAQAETVNSNLRWWQPDKDTYEETIFGLIQEVAPGQTTSEIVRQNNNAMDEAGVNLTRVSIALAQTSVNKTIDNFLEDGYNVQIIARWNDGVNGLRGFPRSTDIDKLKSRAEAFFQYYAPYKSQIPFVAVENEWDWEVVHGGNLQDYLEELSIITTIGHKYGFKIVDGGITATALQRWTYSELSGAEQEQWIDDYFVGLNAGEIEYNYLMNIINTYIAGVQEIDIDYSNVHWRNGTTCGDGFGTATQAFMKACNKKSVVCNEFYIRTTSLDLFNATVNEIEGNAKYAVGYSGINESGLAIKFTDAMLNDLVK